MIVTPWQLTRRAELYHQLGSMLSAGLPLPKILETISSSPSSRDSREMILKLISQLQAGQTFAESMRAVEGWMPEFDMALLSVGEKTGRLDESFKLLAAYYSARAKVIRDTIAGLFTTLATLHVFLLIFPLSFLISFVMGIFNNQYSACLPFLVEKAVVFGGGYLAVFFLIFASQAQRGERWRLMVEELTKIIPILGTARKYLILARLSAALEALTSAGVSIVEGWQLAVAASGSPGLRQSIANWRSLMNSGVTPGELVNRTPFFPEMFANLYNTGEQSGQLDVTLGRLQRYYEEEGFRKLRLFTRLMNGTIYGLLVLLVAYNVITFYVGHFNSILNSI